MKPFFMKLYRILPCLILLFLLPQLVWSADRQKRRVLFLNSYHNGYAWSDNILRGVSEVFDENKTYAVALQVEYMDAKRFRNPEMEATLAAFYAYKYKGVSFDLVIASDNVAFSFLLENRKKLFPGVPVVFCGVNDFAPEMLTGQTDVTGVAEIVAAEENINIALSLLPEKRKMVVVGDESPTGNAISNSIRAAESRFGDRLQVAYWKDQDLPTVLENVRHLPSDTFLLYLPQYKWSEGHFYDEKDILSMIYRNTSVPVFSLWEFLMGYGAAGGTLSSGYHHGQIAGDMAVRILSGTPASAIPVVSEGHHWQIYDYRVLQRFGIDVSMLPETAELRHQPRHFYQLNREVFWTLIVSFILLSGVLGLLVVNITRRKVVEEKIKDQLSFLQIVMNTIPIPIYFKGTDGRFLGCNNAFERWFGVQVSNLVNKDDGVLQSRHPVRLYDAVDEELLLTPGVRNYESRIHDVNGTHRHVIVNKATYLNARGDVQGVVGVINDVHEMKTTEETLRLTEEKYRSIFENASKGIFIAQADGTLTNMNRAFAKILGYRDKAEAMEEMEGSLRRHYVHEESRQVFWEILLSGRDVTGFEVEFFNREGRKRWASINARAVYGEDGQIVLVEGIGEDITKRRQAEMALMESRQRLWLVLDNIPQLVTWQDKDLRFMGMNRSASTLFGLDSAQGVIGKTVFELLPVRKDAESLTDLDHQVMMTGEPIYRFKCLVKDGRNRNIWLEINKVPLLAGGDTPTGVLTAAEDITQKVTLERQLLQSQKMDALGRLSGGIAHDFNNILTSIINSTELAIEDVEPDSMVFKDLERVLKASARGSQMVKKILSFSRPSKEEFKAVEMQTAISEGLELLKASTPGNIRLERDLDAGKGVRCLADPTQIHQILMNLCTNALQAIGSRAGVIQVQIRRTVINGEDARNLTIDPGRFLHLSVADNGPGIATDLLDKIFDPFFTTKEKGAGSGLGLSMVHGIVINHGGAVTVTSIPWERTAFDVYFPIGEIEGEEAGVCVEDSVAGTGRILFVEDDADQRETVPRVLRKLGYRVTVAEGADAALSRMEASESPFDLVITDYDMPETNGIVLARRIAAMAPDLPVILVTGRGMADELDPPATVRDVVLKPYNRDSMARAIQKILDETAC